jgi:dTDP-4-amino-4,6-dideoxy-D-galactose acyltransferase
MSDSMDGRPLVEELPWDSTFFGFSIGRINGGRPSETDLSAAISECRSRGIKCAYLLCAADAVESISLAIRHGFRLVDVRVMLDRDVPTVCPDVPGARRASSEDLPELSGLASAAFERSRFFVDGRFPRERVEALFARWIARDFESAEGDVAILEREGHIAGYASGLVSADGTAQVGLVGVAPGFRGLGVGRQVVAGLLKLLADRGVGKVRVVSQGCNRGALRLYEECGFRMSSMDVWLHWWSDEDSV